MTTNSFLVRWNGGWTERVSSSSVTDVGRMEALLGLGADASIEEVNRVADAQLVEFARPRVQTDITILPVDEADTPYLGYLVGDQILVEGEAHRVLGLTVTEDANTGRAIYVPSLNDDVVLDPLERMAQALTKMIPGTLGGRSKVAQPVVPVYQPRALAPLHDEDFVLEYATVELPAVHAGWAQGTTLAPADFGSFNASAGNQPYGAVSGGDYYVAFWEWDLSGLPSYFYDDPVVFNSEVHMRFTLNADDPTPDPPATSPADFVRLRYEPGHGVDLHAPATLTAWQTWTTTYFAPQFPGGAPGLYSMETTVDGTLHSGDVLLHEGNFSHDWFHDFAGSGTICVQATISHNVGKQDVRQVLGGADPTLVVTYPTNAE